MLASILLIAGLASIIPAQDSSTNYTSQYTVDPNTVPAATKLSWCTSQKDSCIEICDGQTSSNNCSNTDLSWSCSCSYVTTPNISSYQQTVPWWECTQWKANCQTSTTDAAVQQACLGVDCGPNNPATMLAYYSSSASAAAASSSAAASSGSTTATTTTGSASGTSTSATAASTTSKSAATAKANVGGNVVLGAGAIALVGLAL